MAHFSLRSNWLARLSNHHPPSDHDQRLTLAHQFTQNFLWAQKMSRPIYPTHPHRNPATLAHTHPRSWPVSLGLFATEKKAATETSASSAAVVAVAAAAVHRRGALSGVASRRSNSKLSPPPSPKWRGQPELQVVRPARSPSGGGAAVCNTRTGEAARAVLRLPQSHAAALSSVLSLPQP